MHAGLFIKNQKKTEQDACSIWILKKGRKSMNKEKVSGNHVTRKLNTLS